MKVEEYELHPESARKRGLNRVAYFLTFDDGSSVRDVNGKLVVFRTRKEAEEYVAYETCEKGK